MRSLKLNRRKRQINVDPVKTRVDKILEECEIIRDIDFNKIKNSQKKSHKELKQKREQLSLELRLLGKPYNEISQLLGISAPQCYLDVKTQLKRERDKTKETIEEVRDQEIKRLNRIINNLFSHIERGRPLVDDKGKIITDNDNKPLTQPDFKSIDRVLKVMVRRSKLLGLDQPLDQTININDQRNLEPDTDNKLIETLSRYLPNDNSTDNEDNKTIH